jgi:hypothetical protein
MMPGEKAINTQNIDKRSQFALTHYKQMQKPGQTRMSTTHIYNCQFVVIRATASNPLLRAVA